MNYVKPKPSSATTPPKTKSLVVLSGGQDSTICLFLARAQGHELHAVTFNYGQRHSSEVAAAAKVAEIAGVATFHPIFIPNVLESASPLIDQANDLEQYASAEEMEAIIGNRVEKTFVPMRNALFLTIAANRAVALGCTEIVTGVCQEDNANYPDCWETFVKAMQKTINRSLGLNSDIPGFIKIRAPLLKIPKHEAIRLAYEMPDCWRALSYTQTGYDGAFPPIDKNHANVLRAQAFEKARLPDPLILRAVNLGLMQLPDTSNYDASR